MTTHPSSLTQPKESRPTMGNKTIRSIERYDPISSQELKMLSRRIDPQEPLSSPHASPRKPPLPTRYGCQACNKRYKTQNGLKYHLKRCPKLSCVCSHQVASNSLIECGQCHLWLHRACVEPIENYSCPRCLPSSLEFLFSVDFHTFMDEKQWDLDIIPWMHEGSSKSLINSNRFHCPKDI